MTAFSSSRNYGQWSSCIGYLQLGQFMKEKTILGDVHLFATILLMQFTWKTCLQPSLMQGSDPSPLTQQIVQYASSSVSGSSKLGSSSTPIAFASSLAFYTHSAFKHGKHSYSPKNPLHGWPHGNVLSQLSPIMSWHSYRRQTSSNAPFASSF